LTEEGIGGAIRGVGDGARIGKVAGGLGMRRGKARTWVRGVLGMAVLAVSAAALGQPAGKGGAPAATGAAAGATSTAAADPAADAKRAELEKHFNAGIEFAGKRQWPKAVEELMAAYRIKPLPQIAGNLGEAELQVGNYRDAAEHVEKYLREEDPTQVTAADRKRAEAWLAKAKKNVAALSIRVTLPAGAAPSGGGAGGSAEAEVPSGVEVLVDDKKIDLSPFPKEIYVEPGKHTIVARTKTGNARDEVWGEYPKGTAQEVKLELKEVPVAAPTATASATATGGKVETGGPNTKIVIGGGVVAGVFVVAGAVLAGLSSSTAGEAAAKGGWDQCYDGSGVHANCDDLNKLRNSAAITGNLSTATFIGGALIGTATLLYGLRILPPGGDAKKQVTALPIVTPSGGGISVQGHF